MPRRRKDEQTPAAAPGQAYGESQDQIQAQNVIPLPNNRVAAAESHQAGAAGGPPPAPLGDMAAALAAATGMPPPGGGGLAAPTQRPGEPITAGLTGGPGPGPPGTAGPSRARASSVADTFAMLYDLTGDARYRSMASVAAQRGV